MTGAGADDRGRNQKRLLLVSAPASSFCASLWLLLESRLCFEGVYSSETTNPD
jgi:hypothetical protein